ncbi:MAG: hypothetical protein Q9181_003604 [Wetmoreana brouardii]
MFEFFRSHQYQYAPINGGSRLRSHYNLQTLLVIAAILLTTTITSFYAGRLSMSNVPDPIIKLSSRNEIFRYNRTFGAAPSNASDAAWESIFPEQGGFFKHPIIAPQRSALAVFHQLHSGWKNGIRQGYWALHSAAIAGEKVDEDDIPMMYSPAHIRHCIDLIRHSLMCQPDTTVEVKDPEIGGVTGFGTEHQCRDWDKLMRWTREWQAWEQDPRTDEKGEEEEGMDMDEEHVHHGQNG